MRAARSCRHDRIPGAERADHVREAGDGLGSGRVAQRHDRRLDARLRELPKATDVLVYRRRAGTLAGLRARDHARGCEMRDGDGASVAALRRAVLAQHVELPAHGGGIAAQVAGVRVAGDEPQRAPLARAADEDRDAFLERPRVARRCLDREGATLEARRPRSPHQRQQLERVLEPREALGQRRELPAVEPVLALEPGRADPAQRAAARQHVERRDDLREVGDVAVRDAGDERAEPDPLRHSGEVGERRVAFEHVVPLAPDLRDLEEVVHHPEAREARLLGGAGELAERRCRRRGMAGEAEARDLQAEVERHRILLLAGGGGRGGQERGRDELDGPGAMHGGEALGGEPLDDPLGGAQLSGEDLGRHRDLARAVALPNDGRGRVAHDCVRRHAVALRELAPRGPALGLEPGRVDHGREPPAQALGDDQVEHLERVAAGALVALAGPDDGAEPVGRDDLVGMEPRVRPVRLAGRGRADQHDEARIGEAQRRRFAHARGISCARAGNLRHGSGSESATVIAAAQGGVVLPAREPFDWPRLLDWLGARAIAGLEAVADGIYTRGGVAVARVDGGIEVSGEADPAVVARVFDVGHDPAALGDDPLFERAPGIRVPGAWSGWELAVRAVLGQQVSVAGARRTAQKLVAELGEAGHFPPPEAVASGPLPGMPAARARALRDPDAWPGSDLWLKRAAPGSDPERWRPWRAYAAMVLWQTS